MDRIRLSTLAYRPPEEVFPAVVSFRSFPRYTDHLESVSVRREGDDEGVGAYYDLRLTWWKLTYTARSEVVAVDSPTALEWRLRSTIDAHGEWRVEPEPESAPDGVETASRIYFEAVYDPHSAEASSLSIPRFVSLAWVIRKVKPRLLDEAQAVVQELVTDIEGSERDVDLEIHEMP